jgi:uncharacterized protein (TIGR04255 family)
VKKSRPDNLPDFAHPPVTEVALSIQFASLERVGSVHAGLLWLLFKDDFPTVTEHAAIPPAFETFGSRPALAASHIELMMEPRPSRFWFHKGDDSELIQVQRDRFVHNWRKQGPEDVYPRYERIRERFEEELKLVQKFLGEGDLGTLRPNQSEVTYINHIGSADIDLHRHPEEALTCLAPYSFDGLPGEPENSRLQLRFAISGADDKPIGRLHIVAAPVFRTSDGMPLLQLTMTARGRPEAETVESALAWLDIGRRAVVRGFAAVTTPKMHEIWGRRDA